MLFGRRKTAACLNHTISTYREVSGTSRFNILMNMTRPLRIIADVEVAARVPGRVRRDGCTRPLRFRSAALPVGIPCEPFLKGGVVLGGHFGGLLAFSRDSENIASKSRAQMLTSSCCLRGKSLLALMRKRGLSTVLGERGRSRPGPPVATILKSAVCRTSGPPRPYVLRSCTHAARASH